MIGQTISHYRIVDRIGAGGMGVVYKAEDLRLRRTVALKFLPLELTQDPDAKDRLHREAQAASALDHPNICTIHEIDETPDGHVFIAMSYYDGETLKQRIARGPMPIADSVRIATDTARAVAAAHEAGVIHRDLKPANIILTRRGEVKLLDFGVARLSGRTALTRTGITVGTIAYMAPEQLAGQNADPQTDVWGLGVVLYEMLTGRLPFDGQHEAGIIHAIANATPTPLRELRAEVPAALERIVARALQKLKESRYPSAHDLLLDFESLQPEPRAATTAVETNVAPAPRRDLGGLSIVAGAARKAVAALASPWTSRARRVRAARQSVPQLCAWIQQENFSAAFRLMRSIEPYLSGEAEFEKARSPLLMPANIHTTPEGAEVYVKGYDEPDADWLLLGRTPLELRGPLGYYRLRIEKPGFVTYEGAGMVGMAEVHFSFAPEGTVPEGMVLVPNGTTQVAGVGPLPVDSFFIDRYEVTNRQYKMFVDAGGYSRREYWRGPFTTGGRALIWEEVMALLRDATGRPGPSAWEVSAYPKGQEEHPVSGVSWYEALAYAAWAGKELPTIHHWRTAAPRGLFSDILEHSNFSNHQVAPVGTYKGIGEFGTYDMAGNVREWCLNATGDRRYILGGAWNEPNYMYQSSDALDPFDRSAINGFRCIKRPSIEPVPDALLRPIELVTRDYRSAVPVSDREFEIFRRLYDYDPIELKAVVESTDDSSDLWRVERVSYAAAYGGERIPAYLFLPRHVTPPYQTVVYFPHSGGEYLRSFELSEMSYLGFIVQAGRALLFPMYKGTYERRVEHPPAGPNAKRDLTIARIKDLRRSVDYVLTRPDIDHDRLGYFGVSLGASLGNVALAIEKRFKAAVLWSGGFSIAVNQNPAEIDAMNYAPRVTLPVLMLNGRQDFGFPIETSQIPMFESLGTSAADKRHVLYDGGHVFPFARIIKDTLEWLDMYLGTPREGAIRPSMTGVTRRRGS